MYKYNDLLLVLSDINVFFINLRLIPASIIDVGSFFAGPE